MAELIKIRQGNTFSVNFSVSVNGEPEDLSDATDIRVSLWQSAERRNINASNISAHGNIVRFTVRGEDQYYTGVFRAIVSYCKPNLTLNPPVSRRTLDDVAFEIVASSDMQCEGTPTQVVDVENIALFADALVGGTFDHRELTPLSREATDQHPIGSITGLSTELAGKASRDYVDQKSAANSQAIGINATAISTLSQQIVQLEEKNLPAGGAMGDILAKSSLGNYDSKWYSLCLRVTVTQTSDSNLSYVFTKADFDSVAASAETGLAVSVRVDDTRATEYRTIDLSGIYPAVWNTTLSQIEVFNPDVARGFYLTGTTTASRGCVTFDTPKYIARGKHKLTAELSCRFNSVTGFYEMNGLTDLTESEISYIYSATSSNIENSIQAEMFRGIQIRTNFPPFVVGELNGYTFINASVAFGNNAAAVNFSLGTRYYSVVSNMFSYCQNLKKIFGTIKVNTPSGGFNGSFAGCLKLEQVNIAGVRDNVSFSDTPFLKKESIVYLLTNRGNAVGATFTVTLHPTVFDWASMDSEIQALLAATVTKGPVTLASA